MHDPSTNLIYTQIVRRIILAAVLLLVAVVIFGPARARPVKNRFDRVVGLGNPIMYLEWDEPPAEKVGEVFARGESEFRPAAFALLVASWIGIALLGFWGLRRFENG
jgi:hypothetical protein